MIGPNSAQACSCTNHGAPFINFKFLSSEGCLGMECRTLIILLLFINLSFSIKQTTKLMNCGSMVVTVVPPRNWFSFLPRAGAVPQRLTLKSLGGEKYRKISNIPLKCEFSDCQRNPLYKRNYKISDLLWQLFI